MKGWFAGIVLLLVGSQVTGGNREAKTWGKGSMEKGTPFFIHYPAEVYGAHNRNEDVVCDGHGNCYFANLEGVVKYDGQMWQLITTPGISRITTLAIDQHGKVYAGGYHVAGVLQEGENGRMSFHAFWPDSVVDGRKIGEVESIRIEENKVVYVTHSALWVIEPDTAYEVKRTIKDQEFSDRVVCDLPDGKRLIGMEAGLWIQRGGTQKREKVKIPGVSDDIYVRDILRTGDGQIVVATAAHGIFFLTADLHLKRIVDESRGLCSNVVNALADDGKGSLWLATGKGVVRLLYASMYTAFSEREGLPGEVLSVVRHNGKLYAGTYRGLFCLNPKEGKFQQVGGLDRACWQLTVDFSGILWAATEVGVFRVQDMNIFQVSNYAAMGVWRTEDIYTGEQDALYRNEWQNGGLVRKECIHWERVNQLLTDRQGDIWVSTVYGEVGKLIQTDTGKCIVSCQGLKNQLGNHISRYQKEVIVVAEDGFYHTIGKDSLAMFSLLKDSLENDWWPGVCVEDVKKQIWLTQGDGKRIRVFKDGRVNWDYSLRLKAVEGYSVRVIYPERENKVWLGGSFGLIRVDLDQYDPGYSSLPEVYIRQVIYPSEKSRSIGFRFATDAAGIPGILKFSCRLKGFDREWGEWQEEGVEEYMRLPFGKYIFQVRVCDNFGRISYSPEISFEIPAPFYLRWYAYMVYGVLLMFLVLGVVCWRTRQLLKEKEQLEILIGLRTGEIRQQRDEIRKKSESLEQTLGQLQLAQNELIRQEKMATVGKLTKGLVDRMLNPLNYIVNFAVLSKNLAEDMIRITAEIEDSLRTELKEDLTEVAELLKTNLDKIAGHGESAARILKAMEEILQERKCVLVPLDMVTFCPDVLGVFRKYWEDELKSHGVIVEFNSTGKEEVVMGDRVQLEKVLLSILNNSMLALLKKMEQENFQARISLCLEDSVGRLKMIVKDNGIGIEVHTLEKVFDPFFTTRTAAEAAGVGLYLSREVILNHGGKIGICSEQGIGTEVWVEMNVCGEVTGKKG